jgi:hypothetical protein
MAGTPLKNLRMFEELCGKNAFQNIILTTTMWDEVDQETGEDRERELKEVYWRTMLKRNSTTSRFLRTRESAFNLIEPLIETATRRSSVLLQKELVDMHKNLPATAAGLELFSAMGQLVSQRENLLRRIRHEMRRSDGDEMILEPLQDEHQNLQNSLEAIVLEMQRLRLPLGKRFFIMTDKFFSSRFESLKSLISKRLSKPAAAPNIESPPSSIAPVSHTKDLIDQSPPSLTSHDSTVPSDDQTTPTPIVLNSSEILLGVSGCNQFPSPYGRPSLRLQETNIESPPSPIAPVSHTEHLSTASASGATGISKDLIDQSPPSSTSHTTPLSIQVANGSNHVLSLGKGPTSGMVHSGSNTAKEKAQDTGSTVPSDKTTPTPRVLNSSEIRILPDVSGGKPTISLRTSEETSVSELRRELPVPTPSLSTVP